MSAATFTLIAMGLGLVVMISAWVGRSAFVAVSILSVLGVFVWAAVGYGSVAQGALFALTGIALGVLVGMKLEAARARARQAKLEKARQALFGGSLETHYNDERVP